MQDQLGNRIDYSLDAMGNITQEDVFDPNNVLTRTRSQVYDSLNRLDQLIGAHGQQIDYGYDANANLDTQTDAQNRLTDYDYDALDRLILITDPKLGETDYQYDPRDNLTQVTDPNRNDTVYGYNGWDDLISTDSPDTGLTTSTYDSAGNRLTRTDARGVTVTYSYDALNRLTAISYPDTSLNASYSYDQDLNGRGNGRGRLSSVTDASGSSAWTYDAHGAVLSHTQTLDTEVLTTYYGYDAVGQLEQITYPSGLVIDLHYTQGELSGIDVDGQALLSNIYYAPFGPVAGWTWADGTSHTRGYDQSGRLTTLSLAGDSRSLGYDTVNDLTDLDDSRLELDFGYDELARLTGATILTQPPGGGLVDQTFGYDANGNRLSLTEGGNGYSYGVAVDSNRLLTVAGPQAKSYSYDDAGNITGDGVNTFTYDDRNRLTVLNGGALTYEYNAQGQRVKKQGTVTTRYAYNAAGQLLGEYGASGNAIQEFVYLEDIPVAVVGGGTVYAIHADHLNTPRAITDNGTVVWRWDSDPFGTTLPDDDPDGNGQAFEFITLPDEDPDDNGQGFGFNLRFPGQVYDAETGLHYNYFRDYDPATGRYIQSDPIGLDGGLNSYAYVGGNPLTRTDPKGLAWQLISRAIWTGCRWAWKKVWKWIDDTPRPPVKPRTTGEKWRDFQKNPKDWERVDSRPDPRQPRDGHSNRELWRNKKTGEELGIHDKHPPGNTTRSGKPRHPHPFPPEKF